MDAGTAAVAAAGLAAWGTIMAALLQRTNGSGPLSKKLDEFKVDIVDIKADVRDLRAELRHHLSGDGR